jgi:predicted small lipoprotein YifL
VVDLLTKGEFMKLAELTTCLLVILVLASLTCGLGGTIYLAMQQDAKNAAAIEEKKNSGTKWSSDNEVQMGKSWVDSFNK